MINKEIINQCTEIEKQRYHMFEEKHQACETEVKILTMQTGFGLVIQVRCPKCGETIDITDYNSF